MGAGMAGHKQRLDELLVARGLVADLAAARAEIMANNIIVDDRACDKPGTPVAADAVIRRRHEPEPYVSRGGRKLAGALAAAGMEVHGWRVLDAGASTGGFTDCLLQHGAAQVVAVDVGRGLLAHTLRIDPRVTVVEECNVRGLAPGDLGELFDLVVADLSFISLRTVLPALAGQTCAGGELLLLVKPQFEAEKGTVGSGGIVRDEAVRQQAIAAVAEAAQAGGLTVAGVHASPVTGTKGNQEYFIRLSKH
ncbi:MAG TPA: TlyA family RNA methyltransferase [bacterium]|nr:TlyA family RNA methyltransferase [bacterium]